MRTLAAVAAALLVAPAAVLPGQPARAQAQRDWSQVVVRTPEGGFRMGNPGAPVKVVEYLSLTCPHCASFAEQGAPALIQNYVRSGRVSLEYRNFVLNAYDLAASFLSRCAAPQDYFALNHAILGSQSEWMGRVENLTAEQRRQLQGLQPIQGMQRIVALTGLDAIAARHGISAAEARACLSDQAALDRIIQIRQAGEAAGVNGTPSFAINGRLADHVHDWESLEPLLTAAR
ncbi:MAG TPA: thioredoxin domain-containing protein [Allosphingosinicella sp.]|nr:thioredoxin domain-containing protein [Allosphingosinicella sp.]HYC82162.1 thioredoxin domain-containing protein [Solirubrobacterales bacterium]